MRGAWAGVGKGRSGGGGLGRAGVCAGSWGQKGKLGYWTAWADSGFGFSRFLPFSSFLSPFPFLSYFYSFSNSTI